MSLITDCWQVVPQEKTENKNAIFFAISDNYSFAVANIIMGLKKYSPILMEGVDIIIYHNGISEKNKRLLNTLHINTCFIEMHFPEEWKELLEHPKTKRWGEYVICKFFGFELIKKYEKALHLDADMHVQGDISEIFDTEEEFAWRTIIGWSISEIFGDILPEGESIKSGNGGMLLFTDKLCKYNIDKNVIKAAFLETKDLKDGGTDETTIAWLVYKNRMSLREFDINVYNTPAVYITPESRLVHFLKAFTVSSKPWESLASYLYYTEWAENYQKWLSMGGDGFDDFSKEDYFKLFSYDKAERNISLNNELKSVSAEVTSLLKKVESSAQKISEKNKELDALKKENAELEKRLKSTQAQISRLDTQLKATLNSNSWKITKPLRKISGSLKGIKESDK